MTFMFKKRSKIEKQGTVYKLDYASVDEASLNVQSFLSSMELENDTQIRIRLSIEEALLRWIDHFSFFDMEADSSSAMLLSIDRISSLSISPVSMFSFSK